MPAHSFMRASPYEILQSRLAAAAAAKYAAAKILDDSFEMFPPTFQDEPLRDPRVMNVLTESGKLIQ